MTSVVLTDSVLLREFVRLFDRWAQCGAWPLLESDPQVVGEFRKFMSAAPANIRVRPLTQVSEIMEGAARLAVVRYIGPFPGEEAA